jgi:hypothetical protein
LSSLSRFPIEYVRIRYLILFFAANPPLFREKLSEILQGVPEITQTTEQ